MKCLEENPIGLNCAIGKSDQATSVQPVVQIKVLAGSLQEGQTLTCPVAAMAPDWYFVLSLSNCNDLVWCPVRFYFLLKDGKGWTNRTLFVKEAQPMGEHWPQGLSRNSSVFFPREDDSS